MSDSQFEAGLKMRKAVLGEAYVERLLADGPRAVLLGELPE